MSKRRQRSTRHISPRRPRLEPLESRLCLASSLGWDGAGLESAELSYYIGSVPTSVGLEQATVETAMETALAAWSQVADITFTQTIRAHLPNSLDITFTSIDGSDGILAQAYLPSDVNPGWLAGDIQFDVAEQWEVGNELGSSAFDLVYIAVHEIGHALGLDHVDVAGSIMWPYVSADQVFTSLSTMDIDAIQELYAAAESPDNVTDATDSETDTADTGDTDSTVVTDASDTTDSVDDDTPVIEHRFRRDNHRTTQERHQWETWTGRTAWNGWRHIGGAVNDVLVAAPSHHNLARPADVNGDDRVSPLDALLIIQDLNDKGPRSLGFGSADNDDCVWMIDTSGDGNASPLDVLLVVNELNSESTDTASNSEVSDDEVVTENETTSESTPIDESDVSMDEAPETPVDETSPETDTGEQTDDTDTNDQTTDVSDDGDTSESGETTDDESSDDGEVTDETEEETDEETDIDDGPLEEELDGCPRGPGDLLTRLDVNEDGLLTEDEVPATLWDRLQEADTDGDGAVSGDELTAFRQGVHDPFARYDANEDGLLTEDEVPESLWARWVVGDTNEDLAISPEELEALALAHLRAHAPGHHHGHRHHHGHQPWESGGTSDEGTVSNDEVAQPFRDRIQRRDRTADCAPPSEELASPDREQLMLGQRHMSGRASMRPRS